MRETVQLQVGAEYRAHLKKKTHSSMRHTNLMECDTCGHKTSTPRHSQAQGGYFLWVRSVDLKSLRTRFCVCARCASFRPCVRAQQIAIGECRWLHSQRASAQYHFTAQRRRGAVSQLREGQRAQTYVKHLSSGPNSICKQSHNRECIVTTNMTDMFSSAACLVDTVRKMHSRGSSSRSGKFGFDASGSGFGYQGR